MGVLNRIITLHIVPLEIPSSWAALSAGRQLSCWSPPYGPGGAYSHSPSTSVQSSGPLDGICHARSPGAVLLVRRRQIGSSCNLSLTFPNAPRDEQTRCAPSLAMSAPRLPWSHREALQVPFPRAPLVMLALPGPCTVNNTVTTIQSVPRSQFCQLQAAVPPLTLLRPPCCAEMGSDGWHTRTSITGPSRSAPETVIRACSVALHPGRRSRRVQRRSAPTPVGMQWRLRATPVRCADAQAPISPSPSHSRQWLTVVLLLGHARLTHCVCAGR